MVGAPEVPGFEIQHVLGRGGFGTVYAATQLSVRRTIALKVISVVGLDGDAARRFEAETTTVGSLSWHPHVVPLYDAGITDAGLAYLAMELLPAGSAGDALAAAGPLPPETVIRYGIQVADALAAAHRLGIFHRDIKPDNLLLSERGDVKLADFGIATLSDMTQTAAGGFTGTIAYSAPELFAGSRANPRSEVYGLGATLYALASGHAPFPAAEETPLSLMWKVANADPPPLPPTVPQPLADLIARAMARDPEQRPADAAALQAELERLAADRQWAGPPPPPTPTPANASTIAAPPPDGPPEGAATPPPRRGRRLALVAAAIVAVVLIAAAVALAIGGGDDDADRDTTAGETTETTDAATDPTVAGTVGGSCQSTAVTEDDAPTVTVPDGAPPDELEITDLATGDGPPVIEGDSVQVQYTGVSFSTGEEFDTSWDDLTPLPIVLGAGGVIPGFEQGIAGMSLGGRRELVIPPDLAYGDEGAGDLIGPGETLVFVIDVVEHCPGGASTTEPEAGSTAVELPPGPEGAVINGETPCPAEDGSEERVAVFAASPPDCLADGEALTAEIAIDEVSGSGEATDAGTITVDLDVAAAPTMVNNFVVLSRYQFYDGIPFHRLVPDFVAQVGGSGAPDGGGAPDYGTTGPGYDLPDVEHPTDGYAVGDVAMARAEEVSGSQLFIVTSENGLSALDQAGNYPRFGRVVDGLDLAIEMSQHGDPNDDGAPTTLYVIRDVTIRPT